MFCDEGGAVGKDGLRDYSTLGYIPYDSPHGGEVVSRTLDFAYADYATAKAFEELASHKESRGKKHLFDYSNSFDAIWSKFSSQDLNREANDLLRRATGALDHLYDRGTGLMVPKNRGGGIKPNFRAIEWGNGYTEGILKWVRLTG